nr:VTT domain-containing protein [Halorussus halophilus]
MLVGAVMVAAILGIYLFFTADQAVAERWLNQYGLVALFLILILEGAMLLYFAPSEILVPTGVTLIADSLNDWGTIAAVILVAVVGATIGQYALFLLAKRGGREYLLEKRWFRVDESTLDRFDGWFQKWGRVIVPVSNALLFTRGMLTVPAGFAEMRDWEFVVLSAIGTLIFQSWLTVATLYLTKSGYLGFL